MNFTSRKNLFLITIVFLTRIFFINYSVHAEIPCWNDGEIIHIEGGLVMLTGISKNNPNPQGTEKVADPVNLATGNYYYEHEDFIIPSRGMPLEFTRYYNNQDDYDGPFGIGWSHNYNIFLVEAVEDGRSYVIRRNPDGNKDKFIKNADGSYSGPAGVFDTLIKNAQGYTIVSKNGIIYRFNASGYVSSITDRNGNSINLAYDAGTGVLIAITDAVGRQVSLEYTSERKVSKIRDFIGRIWLYGYSNNDLNSVTTPSTADFPQGTTTTYAYLNHNLISITDARGNAFLTITYDEQDRVDTMVNGSSHYDFNYGQNLTTLYEPKGNHIDYLLNDDGTINKKIEYASPNRQTTYEYDSNKLISKITYPKGNSIGYSYDAKGNLLEISRKPINGSAEPEIVSNFSYEPRFNSIKTSKDPRGNVTTYYYDYEEAEIGDLNGDGVIDQTNGNLVKVVYPTVAGQTPETKFTYNSYGQITTTIDANGNVTKYEYNPTGYLTRTINAFGLLNLSTEMTYDDAGNIKTLKDPKDNIAHFEYDSHNNLIKTIQASPFSYVTIYKYDANDNLVELDKQTDNLNDPWQRTYYTYDLLDRQISIVDDFGNATTFAYDAAGNRNLVRDANLIVTDYVYNERNFVVKVSDALNITEYTYDENGNLKDIKDGKDNFTAYDYDDFDRLTETVYADGSKEAYTYDASSNLKTKKDPKDQIITYAYDALNRLDLKTYPDTKTVDYAYDKGSRLIDITDSIGTIHYDYDAASRITQITYPGSKSISYEYDANSNRTKLIYPDASYITYQYDQLNRLTAVKNQSAQAIAQYTYDALSRREQLDYANNTQALYAYDDVNRLLNLVNKVKNSSNISNFNYTYDKVGNRKTMTTASGIHNYTYDILYRLKSVDYPAIFTDTTFNYDSANNRTSTISSGTTNYTSNNLNQYAQVGSTNYIYDANGSLINDGGFTYAYDYENRLVSAAKPGTTANYKYDAFGRRIEKTVNNATTKFLYDGDQIIAEYDGAGNLVSKFIYGTGIDEIVSLVKGQNIYYYHYDGLGSVVNLTDSSGLTVESYSYDAFGKPNVASTLGNRYMFTGREYDSETGLYYYRARYYSSAMGRFLQRDPIGIKGGINLYGYVTNNPINFIDPRGLCVSLGQRTAFGPGNHLVIILQQSNGNVITIAGDRSGKPNLDSLYGNLISRRNYFADNPMNLRDIVQIKDPLGRSGKNLIRDILNSASKYQNNFPYDPLVDAADGYYNSNSYVVGILLDAGITSIPSLPGWRPGEDDPIPLN